MRTVMRYQCEKCRKIYDSPREAISCEAGHYNLSIEDYDKWLALQKLAKEAGALNSIAKNFNTDKAFDEAIDKLVAFEKEHHLEGK